MSARATINVVSAVADTGITTEVTSSTTYVAAEASAYIDENSGNQWVYETVPLNDLVVQIINKSLSDSAIISDAPSLSFGKYDTETLALVESFARVVSYNREFNDVFTLDDLSSIDKDFYGNKGNVTFISDIVGLDYGKIEDEIVTVSDVVDILLIFLRDFVETTTLTDTSAHTFEKVLTDSISLDDISLINKDYTGYKGNAFGVTDFLATSTSKELEETLVFNETTGLQFSKPTSETITIVDLVDVAIQSKRMLNGLPLNTLIPLN